MLYRIAYAIVKGYTTLCIYLFFDKIEVFGKEHIPKGPVIFTPNHQNAFLDGVITSCLGFKNVSFLARADVFKAKSLQPILKFFKVIPVYRLRDGASEMGKNYDTFKSVQEQLNLGQSILIFPEGNQQFVRYLRPLKKGVFRILKQCENNAQKPVIVPVGLNYERHTKTGFNLVVRYAKPLSFPTPLTNGFRKEKQELYDAMYPLMQQIEEPHMQSLSESEWLMGKAFNNERIESEKTYVSHDFNEAINAKIAAWKSEAEKMALLPWHENMSLFAWLKFFIVGLCYLPLMPFRFLIKKVMKNITTLKGFRLSMTFGFCIFFVPIYVAFLFLIFIQLFPGPYFFAVILAFLIFMKNKRILNRFAFNWRKMRMKSKFPNAIQRLEDLKKEIQFELKKI